MAHARIGCSQSSRFLPQARRIVGSGDENVNVLEIFSEMFQDICGLDNLVALLNEELFQDCVVPCFSGIFGSSHSDSSADELDRLDILT